MADDDRETVDRTTIVETNGGGGGGGTLAVVLLLIVVLVLLFLFWDRLPFGDTADTEIQVPNSIDVNVN